MEGSAVSSFGPCFIFINAALSVALELGVHNRILVAGARMVVQLAIMGLILTPLLVYPPTGPINGFRRKPQAPRASSVARRRCATP